ncbi:MAG: hypothetical protein K2M36_04345 [Clostridia bacterium]|nr:hypothetical protein [Clostridia bacterium]
MENMLQNFEMLARKEKPINAEQLLYEIVPLIEEYFIGGISLKGNDIVYQLPNGQVFCISAKVKIEN